MAMKLIDLPRETVDEYEGTFAFFALIHDVWRYEGMAHCRTRIRCIGSKVEEENGPETFCWFQIA
jgi:hypothetical protein